METQIQTSAQTPTKKTGIFAWLIAIVVLVVLVGAGYWGYNTFVNSPKKVFEQARKYGEGDCVPIDKKKAFDLLLKSAERGYPVAQLMLARIYEDGNKFLDVEKDTDEADKWYEKGAKGALQAAKRGDTKAMFMLARCYAMGKGVDKDKEQSEKWIKEWAKALEKAKNPDVEELEELALGYKYGRAPLEKDVDKAEQIYDRMFNLSKKDANKGNARAMSFLARCYEKGQGVDANDEEAEKWFKKSATAGYVPAMRALAEMQSDPEEEVKWWRKAAEQNDAFAQYEYGKALFEGYGGVEPDKAKGKEWLRKAKDNGWDTARDYLNGLSGDNDKADKTGEKAAELAAPAEEYAPAMDATTPAAEVPARDAPAAPGETPAPMPDAAPAADADAWPPETAPAPRASTWEDGDYVPPKDDTGAN